MQNPPKVFLLSICKTLPPARQQPCMSQLRRNDLTTSGKRGLKKNHYILTICSETASKQRASTIGTEISLL